MMKLYRKEGVNPLGGCLPMVLQIPVFIGLFYALRSSIELRHSPFFRVDHGSLGPRIPVHDPGARDSGAGAPDPDGHPMIAQQKLTPMQADPAQAKMMLIVMPVMMTVMFITPSGLVLYWMVSNVIAISHQLWIGRRCDPRRPSGQGPQAERARGAAKRAARRSRAEFMKLAERSRSRRRERCTTR
jgi:YidC/Oxa1 family membrane protein insertase